MATKTLKTIKLTTIPTINTTFKSFSTQHGYYIPSQNKNNITNTTHTTTLSINSITKGYTLSCKVNGEQQISRVGGDTEYTNWLLKLQAGDVVEVTVLSSQSTQIITYTINEDGVTVIAPKGVHHSIEGTHKSGLDIQDKYRKAAQSAQRVAIEEAPAAQIEEQTVEAPAQEEIVPAQQEQTLTFGKHAGKALSSLDSSYLKWLVSHESKLLETNRWACAAAKIELEKRAQTQETKKAA